MKYLGDFGVNTECIKMAKDSTGVAQITVCDNGNANNILSTFRISEKFIIHDYFDTCHSFFLHTGDNHIVIVTGANNTLNEHDLQDSEDFIRSSKIVLFQFETPLETTMHALKMCKEFKSECSNLLFHSFCRMK